MQNNKRSMSAITSYIQHHLENYFLLPQNALAAYFVLPDNISAETIALDPSSAIPILMKNFLGSIFLVFSCTENDILPYTNFHMYFYFFFQQFMLLNFDNTSNIDNLVEDFFEILIEYIADYQELNLMEVHKNISMPCFSKLQDSLFFSTNDWEEYLYKKFLSSFDTDIK